MCYSEGVKTLVTLDSKMLNIYKLINRIQYVTHVCKL